MDSLCDEIIQLIFYELPDPGPLTITCKRFYSFSQDPYVRARYFLYRYGNTEAIFHALGRGGVVNERVLDILLSSGAHLSRYLCQIAIHHYFHVHNHFIKSDWVRRLPLKVFTYFLSLADKRWDVIPRGKHDDDGSIFALFIKESRFPPASRTVSWQVVQEILEKYKFIPFSPKDPIMAQFPSALAVEPRLLPYAVANGFTMDAKYRDYVFRRMFERPTTGTERTVDEVVENVKELCRLDATMFVSRTVAAEICMEARSNELGYKALKLLHKEGVLLFDLSMLVHDLLKTFLKTRSITSESTQTILRHLYSDFPQPSSLSSPNMSNTDRAVRLVLLLTVFLSPHNAHATAADIQAQLDDLKLGRLTKEDVGSLLINPFMDRYQLIVEYMRGVGLASDKSTNPKERTRSDSKRERTGATKGMGVKAIKEVLGEITSSLVTIECKGDLLKKLYEGFSCTREVIMRTILAEYQIGLDDLPPASDRDACLRYRAKLCKPYFVNPLSEEDYFWRPSSSPTSEGVSVQTDTVPLVTDGVGNTGNGNICESDFDRSTAGGMDINTGNMPLLGGIGQETLSEMIRQDELTPANRSRRRLWWASFGNAQDSHSFYPVEFTSVARWVKSEFGPRSSITAVFMTHAIVNDNSLVLRHFLLDTIPTCDVSTHVPITLKHFELLARLERAPSFYMYQEIQSGAPFYRDENDYISGNDAARRTFKSVNVKAEDANAHNATPDEAGPLSRRRLPRRSATRTVQSYAIPDSDDEAIVAEDDAEKTYGKVETHLQMWIKSLSELYKAEQAKHREHQRQAEKEAMGKRPRVYKNEFFKSLAAHLRVLKKQDQERRMMFEDETAAYENSDSEDDEYQCKTSRPKRRKVS